MRDSFENSSPEQAVDAVRRAARGAVRRRFYDNVTTAAFEGSHAVHLDAKPVRTPAGRPLAGPTAALAEAIGTEWSAQSEVIDPARMPLTRLANAIIDGVTDRPGPVADEVGNYLASDLIFYRATEPRGLVARQRHHWDPIMAWAREDLGANFNAGEGVVYVTQHAEAFAAARNAIPTDPWRLGAVHAATTLTGSALIALALSRGRLTVEEAWQAANVDEDWNMEQWGRDEIAIERRAFRFAEFQAAAMVLAAR